jgi:transcriptional regulator with XRE-family HTH domain
MTLRDYLDQNNLSIRALARKAGVWHKSICRFLNGDGFLNRRTAIKISRATGEMVTLEKLGHHPSDGGAPSVPTCPMGSGSCGTPQGPSGHSS